MKKYCLVLISIFSFLICSGQSNDDLAKHYQTFSAGEIVCSENGIFEFRFLNRPTMTYDPTIIGVIKPNLDYRNPRIFPNPIQSEGVIEVKYNSESGQIRKGDPVTSSSVPGEAMKATQSGVILGIAMEDAAVPSGMIKVRILIQYVKQ